MTTFLDLLLSFRPKRAQRLWPVLVGPTGSGKTSRVRAWADQHGYTVRTILLGTMLPEEILGIPRVVGGRTVWSLPEWCPTDGCSPSILFLDELDKARPEAVAAVLTLLAELRIRDHFLPSDTLIVGAMQPVPDDWLADETARALRARIVPIPVSYDWSYLERQYGVSLRGFPSSTPSIPALPEPSMRQVEYVLELILTHGITAETRQIAGWILGQKWADVLIESLDVRQPDFMKEMAIRLSEQPERIEDLDVQTVIMILPYLFRFGNRAAAQRALVRIHYQPIDQCRAGHEHLYKTLRQWAEEAGGIIPIFELEPQLTGADWVEFVNSTAALCARSPYWQPKESRKK